ncbi:heat shock protein, putative [Ixodes scapularis]|uniref:Heat shock protein, putative n=1 Tax=Ixodes scapularis TaxID=6945 RepID=B7QJZ5_IXOSC|nr:heat shock protein, putative [Ixodes scapularis]|eukprot:XP_002415502.1 heat shock protein, putative [Ixodes scapularis]
MSYRIRTTPTHTTTTIRRRVIETDADDFFDFPKARPSSKEFTTVRHRVTPSGLVTTTTTTTTTPRKIIRDVSLDGMDADPFFVHHTTNTRGDRDDIEDFCVQLDVGLSFKCDDISVKTRAGLVFVNAKRTDGSVTREFNRKIPLPDGVDPLCVRALLSPTGTLIIKAPRNMSNRYTSSIYERHVPVRMGLY